MTTLGSGQTLAGYRLGDRLGQGGMGAVHEALSPSGERVAVKVMTRASDDPVAVRRFLREVRAMRAIEHRHVVRVLDAGDDGTPFLVMERLDGTDLASLLRRAGALEPAATARVFVQAARGLAAAHARGIVHRDLKPSNLFLHEESGVLVTKLCDFGVAKSVTGADELAGSIELTHTGGLLGSPLYMSPEQASNARDADARSDLWSLSLSLYEALSGQRPWARCSTVGQLILAICTEDLPPLGDLAPWVSPALAGVVHRGLAREAHRRWASSDELADALEALAQPGEVTLADLESLPAAPRRPPVARDPSPGLVSGSDEPFTLSASQAPRSATALAATRAASPVTSALSALVVPTVSPGLTGATMVSPETISPERAARRLAATPRATVWLGALGLGAAVAGLALRAGTAPRAEVAASVAPVVSSAPALPASSARLEAAYASVAPSGPEPPAVVAPASASVAPTRASVTRRAAAGKATVATSEPVAPRPVPTAEPKMHGDL